MRQIPILDVRCQALVAGLVLAVGGATAPSQTRVVAKQEEPTAGQGFDAGSPFTEQATHDFFVRLHRLASLSRAEQARQVDELYVHFAQHLALPVSLVPGPDVDPAKFAKEEPVAVAKRFAAKHGLAPMLSITFSWSWRLLKDHEPAVTALAIADLQHEHAARQRRGLRMAEHLVLKGTFEAVLRVFVSQADVADVADPQFLYEASLGSRATSCPVSLDDPRAIGPIAARVERDPDAFQGALHELQRARPAHPTLVRMLRSEDPRVRECAACALAESGDPTLVPEVLRCLEDARPAIRRHAASMGLHLHGAAYEQVLPRLLQSMSDPDSAVRCILSHGFCDRRELRACDAIGNLLVHPGTSPVEHAFLRDAVERWKAEALGAFAQWASRQCAK